MNFINSLLGIKTYLVVFALTILYLIDNHKSEINVDVAFQLLELTFVIAMIELGWIVIESILYLIEKKKEGKAE